jgi:hypothetical protein
MTKASDNVFPKLIGAEGAAPGTPSAATAILYVKADGLWYSKDDAGAETLVSGGAGSAGDVATDAIWTTAGMVAVATGTATATEQWPPGHELAYVQKTTDTVIAATTEAGATTIVTAGGIVCDGSMKIRVTFYAPQNLVSIGKALTFALYDDTGGGAASIGQIGVLVQPVTATGTGHGDLYLPFCFDSDDITPSAATHTYSLRAYTTTTNLSTVYSGAGGSGALRPVHMRITTV